MEIINGVLKYNKNGEKHNFSFKINEEKTSNDDVIVNIVEKNMDDDYCLSIALVPKVDIEIDDISLEIDYEFAYDDRVFINGYQSWTLSREFGIKEKMKGFPFYLMSIIEGKHKLSNLGDYKFKKYSGKKGRLHGYTYTYIKDRDDYLVLIGSLSEKKGFTVFEFDTMHDRIVIRKDCTGLNISSEYQVFDLVFAEGKGGDVFERYFKYQGFTPKHHKPLTGWTSWYNYYNRVTEKDVLENLKNFSEKKVPIDIIQIDDGYQKALGDWKKTNEKFPGGMKTISDRIRECGYKPGIWISPFVCEKKSELYENHEDWILKDRSGKPVVAGHYDMWGGDYFALDIYSKGFREHLRDVFDTICNKWNFEMIKVDFIFAVATVVRKDKTRSEIISDALDFLNEVTKGKMILGCGVPLGNAFGKIPYCRIGPDVSLMWEDERLKKINYRERISTVSSLTNTIFRSQLNNMVFGNDPDVFILRNENVNLNINQKHTLFLANLIFGNLIFTSDNIANYDEETLKLYLSAFPYKNKKILGVKSRSGIYSVTFSIGELVYLAYINLTGLSVSLKIEKGNFYGCGEIISGEAYLNLDGYESLCFLKIDDREFSIAGGTGSFFPGSEIENFKVENNEINFSVNEKTAVKGELIVKIPDGLSEVKVNGKAYTAGKTDNLNLVKINL